MLATEFVTPKVPPCSFLGVIFEMKLSTTVRIVPLPKAMIVNEEIKIIIFAIKGIRDIPNIRLGPTIQIGAIICTYYLA